MFIMQLLMLMTAHIIYGITTLLTNRYTDLILEITHFLVEMAPPGLGCQGWETYAKYCILVKVGSQLSQVAS